MDFYGWQKKKQTEGVSPVDSALLFGHYSLEVSELEETVVEVVQVENTHQQEESGNENPGEEHGDIKPLQAEVTQAVWKMRGSRSFFSSTQIFLRYL